MLRSLLTAAAFGAALMSAACGGDAFTAGSGGGDAGAAHDGSSPPDAPAVDAVSEPPPSCSGGFACVPAVPTGWTGPLEVYSGSAAPPLCSGGFAQGVNAYDMLQAQAAKCGCNCGASTITCSPPTMIFYASATCGTAVSCATQVLTQNTCMSLSETGQCLGGKSPDLSLTPGTSTMEDCAPQPTQTVPPYSWGTQARGCVSTLSPAQVDCPNGQICAPTPEPGFGPKLCVSHAGDVLCPGGGYGVRRLLYTSADDTRGCTPCACGAPAGGVCNFVITEYTSADETCTGTATAYGPGTTCQSAQPSGDFLLTMMPQPGTCAPGTSSATGATAATGPVTVCCPL